MFSSARNVSVAALVLALIAGCGGKSDAEAIQSAKSLMGKRDYNAAVIELKSVLQRAPDQGEARFLMGSALMQLGQFPAALVELTKAQELRFDEDQLAPKLARALLASNKFKDVLQAYSGTRVKDPSLQAELSAVVAVAHARQGQSAEAKEAISAALKADPAHPWALLIKARLLAVDGQFDQALAEIDKVLKQPEGAGEANMLRGTLLRAAKKDTEGAAKAFEEAAKDPGETLNARAALIHLQLAQGQVPAAAAQLALLQKSHAKSPQTIYLDALIAYSMKDYARADALLDQLLRLAPSSTQLLVLGGAASLHRGALLSAETRLGKVVQTVENVPLARKLLAETYLRMGQPDKALATLRWVLEQRKPDAGALALAGQAHLQAGRSQEAESMFAAAVKARPDDVPTRTALALTDLVKGNATAAFDALELIARQDPGETADLAIISAHLRRREHDQALAAIARLEKKLPGNLSAQHLRGVALLGKGDSTGARTAFEAALKLDSQHFASATALASLDLKEGKPAAARERMEALVKANPKNISARMAVIELMDREKTKPETLMAAIDEAIKVSPTEGAPRVAKIQLLARTNDIKGAASSAQAALAALPNSPEVLESSGLALSLAGDHQQAISAFNRLTSVLPRSPTPHLRLADLHAKRGDTAAVTSSLNRAFEAAPESPEVHKRLISSAVSSKDYKAVLSAAKELQRRFPNAPMGFLLEGDAQASRKQWPQAIIAFRAAVGKPDSTGRAQKSLHSAIRASGDKPGADKFANEWLKANSRDLTFRDYLGSDAILRKDYSVAERYFREILDLQPRDAAAANNLAWLMAERGDKSAVQMSERALGLAPNSAAVLDTMAKAQAAAGQWDKAVEVEQKAINADPARVVYRLRLAEFYVKAGRKEEASKELAELAKLGKAFPYQSEVEALARTARQ